MGELTKREFNIEEKDGKFFLVATLYEEMSAQDVLDRIKNAEDGVVQISKDIDSIPAIVVAREKTLRDNLKFAMEDKDVYGKFKDRAEEIQKSSQPATTPESSQPVKAE